MRFTDNQQKAIDFGGNALLVSAAAGSGKTAVLTERVVKKVTCDDPVMLDRLMILTFTNAAADEMKTRINDSLRERLKNDKDNAVIRTQLSLLPSAQISTIHSACLSIIRENFEALGLDPRFSVGDEARLSLQKSDTLLDFVEQLYEIYDTDTDAKTVIDALVRGRDDNALFELLDKGSAFFEGVPFCEQFIKDTLETDVIPPALEAAHAELTQLMSEYSLLITDAYDKAKEFLTDERDSIGAVVRAIEAGVFDEAQRVAKALSWRRYPNCPKTPDIDPTEWALTLDCRKKLKEKYPKIIDRFLYAPAEQLIQDRQKELVVIKSFVNLCLRLNGILLQKRKDERIVSFNDIERYTLDLLIDKTTLQKTELARTISARYDEIIVDEYQDCNDLQDLIFKALSDDEKNVFTVGDVKQSIYRFRGAQPSIFLKKQTEYLPAGSNPLDAPSKINLACNFRSHPKVLAFVNTVFYKLMTRDIDYRDGHELVASSLYDGHNESSVDLAVLVTSDNDKLNRATRIEVEARYVADKIKSIVGREKIYDAKAKVTRTVTQSDIAILLRAPKSCGTLFERALIEAGLECQNNNPSEKYLDTPEVRDAIAFLQAIDNPYDDIPLITVMYSRVFGFDTNELGLIRAEGKGMLFYDAVKKYAEHDRKCADFIALLKELRSLSVTLSVYDLINTMYEKSGMLLCAGNANERANLMLLCELAAAYEADRYRGLFAFINYLLKLAQKDEKLPSARLKATDDCVNLLSIHHSKGLEYPVVFVCDCAASIQKTPKGDILFDRDCGIGGFVREADTHREFAGVMRSVISHKILDSELEESIRLLYVALTRAKSRLYITGCVGAVQAEKMIKECALSDNTLTSNPSFLKWIIASILDPDKTDGLCRLADLKGAIKDGICDTQILSIDEVLNGANDFAFTKSTPSTLDKDTVKALITRLPDGRYDIPAKLSVSEIKTFGKDIFPAADFKKPRFLQGGATGTDRGSATHKFLQFCDFGAINDTASFQKEKERLVTQQFITKTEADLTNGDKVIEFLTSDIMKSLLRSGNYYKEKRFMFTLPAKELGIDGCDEKIIVQGVLDCYFITEDGAVIVDYKTDRVTSDSELLERYAVQLDMYEKALFIKEGIKTHKKYIYSFALSRFILV